ncbi:hypothetical protein F66182_11453, partial [Fusarium sp. NRRL 66182]
SYRATRHDRPPQIPVTSDNASPELLMIGNTSETWRIGNIVRKLPRTVSDKHITNANIAAAKNEANVYLILGEHPLIAKCHAICPARSYIDLEYYSYGTLRDYISLHRSNITSYQLRLWACVRHADLRLEQWLLDQSLQPHLADFNGSGFDGNLDLGLESTAATSLESVSHRMPRDFDKDSTVESDLFALGSTLYELGANSGPFEGQDDNIIEANLAKHLFPSTDNVLLGDIIMRCWKGYYQSADQILEDLASLV